MDRSTTLTVRLGGALSEHVAEAVGENGSYENVSEYVRDLIRRDKDRLEKEALARLKAELQQEFGAPDSVYKSMTPGRMFSRNKR